MTEKEKLLKFLDSLDWGLSERTIKRKIREAVDDYCAGVKNWSIENILDRSLDAVDIVDELKEYLLNDSDDFNF